MEGHPKDVKQQKGEYTDNGKKKKGNITHQIRCGLSNWMR